MRSGRLWPLALGLAALLALAACAAAEDSADGVDDAADETSDDDPAGDAATETPDPADDEDGEDDGNDTAGGGSQVSGVAPGMDDCIEDPTGCNAGERMDGGSLIWVVDQSPDAWFSLSPDGGSVYTLQALHGVLPHTGGWGADGEYEFNMDLLAAEPELLSEAPFTFEMRIDPDAVWDDGTPITAEDMILTWQMSTSEAEGHCTGCRPRSTAVADLVETMESSDDGQTLTVTYKEGVSDPEWFGWFSVEGAVGGFIPRHVGEAEGFDLDDPTGIGDYFNHLDETMPVWSGGPYRIESGDLDTQVLKVPNEAYWGDVPTLDTLIVRFIEDEGSWVPALDNGEIHGGAPAAFNEDVYTQVSERPGVHAGLQPGPSWEHLDVNLDNTQLADLELRRAIFTTLDVADMAQRNYAASFPDFTIRTNHMFEEGNVFHQDVMTESGQGSGDVEAARDILDAAGYEGFDGSGLTLDGAPIGPFRLRATPTGVRPTTMELMQAQLAQIGVDVQIEVTSDLGGTLAEQDYDLMLYGWSGSPFFTALPFQQWHSSSASNWGGLDVPEIDALADAIGNATSLEEAAALATEAMELVVEQAYVLPLWDSPVFVFASDEFVNVRDNPNTSLRAHANNHEWGLAAQ